MPAKYERLATSDEPTLPEKRRLPSQEPTSDVNELQRRLAQDPRFNPPTPPAWKRFALIIFMLFLLWVGFRMRVAALQAVEEPPKVVHATRCV